MSDYPTLCPCPICETCEECGGRRRVRCHVCAALHMVDCTACEVCGLCAGTGLVSTLVRARWLNGRDPPPEAA